MSFTIAVAGKGGTGKTTISSLIIKNLIKNDNKPLLAIDADANVNLNEQLGVVVDKTICALIEEMQNKINGWDFSGELSKDSYMEYQLQSSLIESEGFDLLVMGSPEGPGCYCHANNLLRRHIETLSKIYPYIVVDNEAGMEHLSRRTTQKIDILLIVAEPNPISILTASRIRDIAEKVKIKVQRTGLVINRMNNDLPEIIKRDAERFGLEIVGIVPADNLLTEYSLSRTPTLSIPDSSPSAKAIEEMLSKLLYQSKHREGLVNA